MRTHRITNTRKQSVGQPSRILVVRDYHGLCCIRKFAGHREKDLASNSGAVHQDYDSVALGSVAIHFLCNDADISAYVHITNRAFQR